MDGEKFNRQLHKNEIKWIEEHAAEYAALNPGMSEEEAKNALAQQALRDVDAIWSVALGEKDTKAQAFINDKLSEDESFTNTRGEQQTLFSTEHGEFYDPSKYAIDAVSTKAGRDIYKNAQEVGKEVLSNPEELKKRLENRLKEDLDKLPQRLVDTIDDMANKNPVEVVVDNLVGRAESIVDTTETVVGMATTPSETFDDIYGDGTSSTVETVGLTTGAIGAVVGKGKGGKVTKGDKTPNGIKHTEHSATRVSERNFDDNDIDSIITNNKKTRTKQIDENGKVTWRYQDKRGNTVITDEHGENIVTVYSHPKDKNDGKYIPNPKKKSTNKKQTEENFNTVYEKAPDAKKEIDALADDIVSDTGGSVAKAPIKSKDRALEKIENDYDGDTTQIKDLARNTIIVDAKDIDTVKAKLEAKGGSVKTINGKEDELGYSGLNTTIKTKSGLTAEIQVNTPEMIYAKESPSLARELLGDKKYNEIHTKTGIEGGQGHKYYEEWRKLDKSTPEAKAIAKKSKAYYDSIRSSYGN